MEKKVRVLEIHTEEGKFEDIYQIYQWLGKIDTCSAGHKFKINLEILETKEE